MERRVPMKMTRRQGGQEIQEGVAKRGDEIERGLKEGAEFLVAEIWEAKVQQ
jgi:hypothetical protein